MAANPGASDDSGRPALRELPAVDRLAAELGGPPHLAVAAARIEIEALRERLAGGVEASVDHHRLRVEAVRRVELLARGSLRPVLNATGVILHTNLGRAPLAAEAAAAAAVVGTSYSNLELDLERGERGSRHDHVEPLLTDLAGAAAAFAVNNNAAAVLLALTALAGGGEVIVGRDQLVEIGDSFRIPEIVAGAGVRLVEVGTTNRTRVADYAAAIGAGTTALMRVHQSNFRTVGFTEAPVLAELAALASDRGLPLIDDLGSGAAEPLGEEPVIGESVATGAVACFSADKLLGGPQAGVIAGPTAAIERCRRHPLARAVRIDKLQLAALEATLRLRRDGGATALPAAAMLAADEADLRARAESMAEAIGASARVEASSGRAGGGALPGVELPGPVCVIDPGPAGARALAAGLRSGEPPVVVRVAGERVILDPRTLSDAEAPLAAAAVRRALG